MKKVLIISYYWPPAGGGGVQRWLKMSKYLPENGWKPIIYTADPDTYVAEDQSLLQDIHPQCEVIKYPIWEPYKLYGMLTGKTKKESNYSGFISKDKKPSWKERLSVYIRSNFFIPDARKFWIEPSIRFLNKWLQENKVDTIISTGPPHSMHMIALGIKKKNKAIPWVADFRDPWTFQDFYDQLPLSKRADKKHKRLESQVGQYADHIVTVSWDWQQKMKNLFNTENVDLILNGFDPEDFPPRELVQKREFKIVQLGSMNKDRNTEVVWKSIKKLILSKKNSKPISIELIGQIDGAIRSSIEECDISAYVTYTPFMPHAEAIDSLYEADLLLLPINKTSNNRGILPGKLYEYIATGIPILAIGPKLSDVNKIISQLDGSSLFEYDDDEGVLGYLSDSVNRSQEIEPKQNSDIEKYSRKHNAKLYTSLLNRLIG